MSILLDSEGSEDVNDFLMRIREMGERRDREDEERTRKLEEEIQKDRVEREARRAGQWWHEGSSYYLITLSFTIASKELLSY